jgi:hypothetical protein
MDVYWLEQTQADVPGADDWLQEQSKKAEAMVKLEAAWEQVPERPCEAVVKQSLPN